MAFPLLSLLLGQTFNIFSSTNKKAFLSVLSSLVRGLPDELINKVQVMDFMQDFLCSYADRVFKFKFL